MQYKRKRLQRLILVYLLGILNGAWSCKQGLQGALLYVVVHTYYVTLLGKGKCLCDQLRIGSYLSPGGSLIQNSMHYRGWYQF